MPQIPCRVNAGIRMSDFVETVRLIRAVWTLEALDNLNDAGSLSDRSARPTCVPTQFELTDTVEFDAPNPNVSAYRVSFARTYLKCPTKVALRVERGL